MTPPTPTNPPGDAAAANGRTSTLPEMPAPHHGTHADAGPDVVELDLRPASLAILLIAGPWLWLCLLLWGLCWWGVWWAVLPEWKAWLLFGPALLTALVLVIAEIIRSAMWYQLSRHRARSGWGVLSKATIEVRLEDVRNVAVLRSLPQRFLGLGAIGMTTAGGPSVVWWHIARPLEVAGHIRRSMDVARVNARMVASSWSPGQPARIVRPIAAPAKPISVAAPQAASAPEADDAHRVPVIGLVGGIGAGKSTVARAFARLGCLVVDSDARAKAAIDQPEVRDTLAQWWGDSILHADGRVDRSKVAAIIFSDPEQRTRLERLVHPIVREDRAAMIREAAAAGARAVIVDAPLLFEAGVDAECDAVVFVDAPREQRLARVQASRNWDQQELDRREGSQLPLPEKRRRSHYVVDNAGKLGGLDSQCARILLSVEAPSQSDSSILGS